MPEQTYEDAAQELFAAEAELAMEAIVYGESIEGQGSASVQHSRIVDRLKFAAHRYAVARRNKRVAEADDIERKATGRG